MSGTINIDTVIKIVDGSGNDTVITSKHAGTSVDNVECRTFSLADATTAIIWDPTTDSGPITTFDYLIVTADNAVDLELTVNEGDAAEELSSVRVASGVLFVLGADDSYYNHSASDIYAGTLDVIDKIRVRNTAASAAANVTVYLVN